MQDNHYDAIVIGSGISGGWAAKELCEKGLKTLVLERGRNIEHLKDYPTWSKNPWDFPHGGWMPREYTEANPITSKAAGFGEDTAHFFIKDAEQPYIQDRPFDWIRGYQVGGKSLTWGRACQRWSDFEFKAPERFGYGTAWPIGYDDIASWYSHVERFIGVCGNLSLSLSLSVCPRIFLTISTLQTIDHNTCHPSSSSCSSFHLYHGQQTLNTCDSS